MRSDEIREVGERPAREQLLARIDNDFRYHAPQQGQVPKYDAIRKVARDLALLIADVVPMGREQATALTRLEETVMHANAGISRAGG
jgi:hypothetical protein